MFGEKPLTFFVSMSEAELGPWPKRPELGPGVGQGQIGAKLGTFGMETNATIKFENFYR